VRADALAARLAEEGDCEGAEGLARAPWAAAQGAGARGGPADGRREDALLHDGVKRRPFEPFRPWERGAVRCAPAAVDALVGLMARGHLAGVWRVLCGPWAREVCVRGGRSWRGCAAPRAPRAGRRPGTCNGSKGGSAAGNLQWLQGRVGGREPGVPPLLHASRCLLPPASEGVATSDPRVTLDGWREGRGVPRQSRMRL